MKVKTLLFIAISLGIIIIITGCPADVNDLNSISVVDNIIGKWHAVLDEGDIQQDYTVEITKDPNSDSTINISNFFNNGASAYAYVNNLEITLPEQKVGTNQIEATGVISTDYQKIIWDVIVDGDHVKITFTVGTITKDMFFSR